MAYYVVALAISLAAYYGGLAGAAAASNAAAFNAAAASVAVAAVAADTTNSAAAAYVERARNAADHASWRASVSESRTITAAYGLAGAVSLAAFAGAYIIDKRRTPPKG